MAWPKGKKRKAEKPVQCTICKRMIGRFGMGAHTIWHKKQTVSKSRTSASQQIRVMPQSPITKMGAQIETLLGRAKVFRQKARNAEYLAKQLTLLRRKLGPVLVLTKIELEG